VSRNPFGRRYFSCLQPGRFVCTVFHLIFGNIYSWPAAVSVPALPSPTDLPPHHPWTLHTAQVVARYLTEKPVGVIVLPQSRVSGSKELHTACLCWESGGCLTNQRLRDICVARWFIALLKTARQYATAPWAALRPPTPFRHRVLLLCVHNCRPTWPQLLLSTCAFVEIGAGNSALFCAREWNYICARCVKPSDIWK
jgi:hypothetical protein